ncbi:hypothetical protein F4813DRAFT_377381 [Daldinia decipiens]|uniref:uncharacterized protein n=1 Tax=Daldinia decipiens TaxID=326647 RepID=UPI0020C1EA99|nr:uncharacterized protein F4813DRAFT_377381 [Daldinia decipiens]KAI1652683.1 hypothetical protein F4813DRAFT_377381 [Daldinia decipiens]
MKLSYAIYCLGRYLYIGAATIVSAWPIFPDLPFYFRHLSGFLQNLIANSLIPTFILDTDHPWLSENRGWLQSYPDVAGALCDKSSLLWTSPSPGHEIPTDLFSRIDINNNKVGISRLGWDNAVSRLKELRNCTAALEDVRYLNVYIFVHTGKFSDPLVDSEMPSELPGLFAEVLTSMPHLERLNWGLDAEHTVAFRDEFLRRNLTLPSVRHLVPGAQSHYLLPMCPGLETLEAGSFFHHASWNEPYREGCDSRFDLVRAASSVNGLREFLMLDEWTPERLEEVLEAMPNLVKLTMEGRLKSRRHWSEDTGEEEETKEKGKLLKKCLSIISRFPKLEELHLPHSSGLHLGFEGGNWCGNAYDGKHGRRYGRSVVKQVVDTTELAGDIAMKAVPHLKTLSIGRTQANFTRNENGDFEIVWPWTGRKEEYAYEIYPL